MRSSDLASISGIGERRLRQFGHLLPLETVSRERTRRHFTTADAAAILIANALLQSGFGEAMAAEAVAMLMPNFPEIVAEKRTTWLICASSTDKASGWKFTSGIDKAALFDETLGQTNAIILDVTSLLKDALAQILVSRRAEKAA